MEWVSTFGKFPDDLSKRVTSRGKSGKEERAAQHEDIVKENRSITCQAIGKIRRSNHSRRDTLDLHLMIIIDLGARAVVV